MDINGQNIGGYKNIGIDQGKKIGGGSVNNMMSGTKASVGGKQGSMKEPGTVAQRPAGANNGFPEPQTKAIR